MTQARRTRRTDPFEILARIVGDWFPQHAAGRTPCRLEPDAPAQVAALWAAVGRSPALESQPAFAVPPLREAGRRLMEEICAEWFRRPGPREAWGVARGATGLPAGLPARFRVVDPGDFQIEITDESRDVDDPPLVAVDDLHPRARLLDPSYVGFTITSLLVTATGRREVTQHPRGLAGDRPLAPLYPGLLRVAEGIWIVEPYARPGFSFPGHLRFETYDGYSAFVARQPDDAFAACGAPPGHLFEVTDLPAHLPGLRVVRHGNRLAGLGQVDGVWIWARHGGLRSPVIEISVDPAHREVAAAWIRSLKGRIKQQFGPGYRTVKKGPYTWDYTLPEHPIRTPAPPPPAPPPPAAVQPPAPARTPEEAAIRAEAEALRRLLERSEPQWSASWRPVRLGRSEPAHVRVFWETLGWSDLLAPDLSPPERAGGRAEVRALLEDYAAGDPGFRLRPKDLPRAYRLVSVDEQGVGFSITDESSAAPDPPIVTVLSEDGRVLPERPSYVRFAAALALLAALRGFDARPHRGRPPRGRERFPRLVPGAVQVTEDHWLVPDPLAEQLLVFRR